MSWVKEYYWRQIEYQNYLEELEDIQTAIVPISKMGLYDGARVALDAVLAEIDNIPDRFYGPNGIAVGLTEEEKNDLRRGLGISQMRDDGGLITVKIGFDGYGSRVTDRWHRGVPIAVIARGICRGTSWLAKYDFISRAVRRSSSRIESSIANRIDKQIQKTIGAKNK